MTKDFAVVERFLTLLDKNQHLIIDSLRQQASKWDKEVQDADADGLKHPVVTALREQVVSTRALAEELEELFEALST